MARALRALPTQIERAKAGYAASQKSLSTPVTPNASRHLGGDLGDIPWERLSVEAKEHWIRVADAVAEVTREQLTQARSL